MSKNPYIVLGIDENATQAEIENAYQTLSDKYSNERFLEGEAGELAARKLGDVRNAYNEAMSMAKKASYISEGLDELFSAEQAIKENRLDEAQQELDNTLKRTAKWHYLQAHLYYKRGWLVECKKQLEIAIKQEPENQKYQSDLQKLISEMNPTHAFGDGKTVRQHPDGRSYSAPRSDTDVCCDSCGTCLCVNLLCNCCGS